MDSVRLKHVMRRLLGGVVLPIPRGLPQGQYSVIYLEDHGKPTERLIDLSLSAANYARSVDMRDVCSRITEGTAWPELWPGDHYKLLVGLVHEMQPRIVVEIGTYQGYSALALEKELPESGVVHTYDVLPLDAIPGQILRPRDLETGRIVSHIADLTVPEEYERHRETFEQADLIFLDAAKDGVMEQTFLDAFERTRFTRAPIIVLDDIRLWNMLRIWRDVKRPKLDLTSFGHWSGTGLVDWCASNREASRV